MKAKEYLDKLAEFQMLTVEMEDEILDIFNIPNEDGYWVFTGDIVFDHYDTSFELTEVDNNWEPTEKQLQKCWDLGFHRCWINYKDGSERYYAEQITNE